MVQRYKLGAGTAVMGTGTGPYAYATESPTGNWVQHSDYAALIEAAKLLAQELRAVDNVAVLPVPPQNPDHPTREALRLLAMAQIQTIENPIARALIEGRDLPTDAARPKEPTC